MLWTGLDFVEEGYFLVGKESLAKNMLFWWCSYDLLLPNNRPKDNDGQFRFLSHMDSLDQEFSLCYLRRNSICNGLSGLMWKRFRDEMFWNNIRNKRMSYLTIRGFLPSVDPCWWRFCFNCAFEIGNGKGKLF